MKETIKQFIDPEKAIAEEIMVEDYDRFGRPIDNYRQSLMVTQLSNMLHRDFSLETSFRGV